jgi:hypothetical protein
VNTEPELRTADVPKREGRALFGDSSSGLLKAHSATTPPVRRFASAPKQNGTSSHHNGGAAVLRTFRARDSDVILSSTDHSFRTTAISTARLQPEVGPGRDARISIKSQVLVIEHLSQEPRDLSDIINDILRLLQLQMDTVQETTHDCSHLERKA